MTQIDNSGHRSRLRQKFLISGLDGFLDYEVIEFLLTIGTPRKDCKQIAKALILKYKYVTNVINASDIELQQIKGIGATNILGIKLAREISLLVKKENAEKGGINLSNIKNIVGYLQPKIGHLKQETFVLLCCDIKGNLIDSQITIGTLNSSLVHPREVFNKAVANHSFQIIVAHNHPSGDTNPSADDILTTRRLAEAGKILGIEMYDHLIIAKDSYTSLHNLGYL